MPSFLSEQTGGKCSRKRSGAWRYWPRREEGHGMTSIKAGVARMADHALPNPTRPAMRNRDPYHPEPSPPARRTRLELGGE